MTVARRWGWVAQGLVVALLVAGAVGWPTVAPGADRFRATRCAVDVAARTCAGAASRVDDSYFGPCRDTWLRRFDVELVDGRVIVRGRGGLYVTHPVAQTCSEMGRGSDADGQRGVP